MTLDAVSGILSHVSREYGDHGYSIERFLPAGLGGAVAIVSHLDGSRFIVKADRHGNTERIPDESDVATELLGVVNHY